jgi:hypothetical protein
MLTTNFTNFFLRGVENCLIELTWSDLWWREGKVSEQHPTMLTQYGSQKGGVCAVAFRHNMKHLVSGGGDGSVFLWSMHCRPNLRHPNVRPYRYVGHQVRFHLVFLLPLKTLNNHCWSAWSWCAAIWSSKHIFWPQLSTALIAYPYGWIDQVLWYPFVVQSTQKAGQKFSSIKELQSVKFSRITLHCC